MALKILKNIDGIATVEFDKSDIVRHRLVRDIVEAYDRYNIINKEV
jgi:phosphate starvation-inducible PhoH-like protein